MTSHVYLLLINKKLTTKKNKNKNKKKAYFTINGNIYKSYLIIQITCHTNVHD